MKKWLALALLGISLVACKKDKGDSQPAPVPHPVMEYMELQNATIKFGQSKSIDLNQDGPADFMFATLRIGDPVLQRDRLQFYIFSNIETYLLCSLEDQTPILNKGDEISFRRDGYEWFEVSAILLAEKIIPLTGTPFWQGPWKEVSHKYLPVQVKKTGQIYHGWIELSFDTVSENLVLHKAALCKEPGQKIKAGY